MKEGRGEGVSRNDGNARTPKPVRISPPGPGFRVCLECSASIETKVAYAKFCSPECRYRARDRRREPERSRRRYANEEYRRQKLAAAAAWKEAHRKPRHCMKCGKPATSSRHWYCDVCRRGIRKRGS